MSKGLAALLNYLPEQLPSAQPAVAKVSDKIILPSGILIVMTGCIIFVLLICLVLAIYKTRKYEEAIREEESKVPHAPRKLDIYAIPRPFAENIKIILQMSIGVGLGGIIVLKILYHLGLSFDVTFLKEFVYDQPTLLIVAFALVYSSAFELAYTLFTSGPDEAIEPLVTGLAAAILLVISGIGNIDLQTAGGVTLLVVALTGLFIIRYFFILEKKGKDLLRGKDTNNRQNSTLTPPLQPNDTEAVITDTSSSQLSHVSTAKRRWPMALVIGILVISMFGMKALYQQRRISIRKTGVAKWKNRL